SEIAAAAMPAWVEIEAAGSVASAGRHSSLLTHLCPPDSSEPGGHRHLHGCAPQRREDSVFLSMGAAAERRSLVFGELTFVGVRVGLQPLADGLLAIVLVLVDD